MGILDAFFGRVFSDGVERELRGGINFTDGLTATENAAQNRNDVRPNFMRVVSLGHVSVDTPSLSELAATTWTVISGTFVAGALTSSVFSVPVSSGPALLYSGAETIKVAVIATLTAEPYDGGLGLFAFSFAVDGTPVGAPAVIDPSTNDQASVSLAELVEVESGETLSLMVYSASGDDVTVQAFSMIAVGLVG